MNVTLETFQQDVVDASFKMPVVVDFWAVWCQPCRILGPVLEKLEKEANGKWKLVKVNTDEEPELSRHFQIRSIPAVKMIREGKIVDEFVGALPEVDVRKWLEKHLPNESKNQLDMAKAMLQAGNSAKARKMLEATVKQEPTNAEARILLAVLLLPDEIDKAADLVAAIADENPLSNKAQAIRTLHRLAHLKDAAGEPQEDWKLYRQGIAAFKKGNYAEALEAWIELVERNRQLDDDGGRKACVALFTLLGSEHELTQKYHRRFTSALY
ncbi:MAG: thioredoxin [candidate division KSB1 bacterium]|nr:thioredoxin [candidate division KSB1 bacterium]MDZ7364721.1 thioredoxin [candidate division KSB1 bacterium]MDZ7402531.1 thioredoxin [candidate division KSB1 bacterium]